MRRPLHVTALLILLGSPISFDFPVKAQGLPLLQQGEAYDKERQKIIAEGWKKVIDFTKDCKRLYPGDSFRLNTCFKYQELKACSGQGHCTFIWRNAQGNVLRVTTFGYGYPLLNWSIE